jgi:dihydrodipicolinate reductase
MYEVHHPAHLASPSTTAVGELQLLKRRRSKVVTLISKEGEKPRKTQLKADES